MESVDSRRRVLESKQYPPVVKLSTSLHILHSDLEIRRDEGTAFRAGDGSSLGLLARKRFDRSQRLTGICRACRQTWRCFLRPEPLQVTAILIFVIISRLHGVFTNGATPLETRRPTVFPGESYTSFNISGCRTISRITPPDGIVDHGTLKFGGLFWWRFDR